MGVTKKSKEDNKYKKFNKINGSHPLKQVIPNGYVDYKARIKKGGKLRYFNFNLAKEMGLIPSSHEHELNDSLTKHILETFSLQIINEYDQLKGTVFPKEDIKEGQYMATRYLQLQHDDKKGRTSGDGRSIWNGQVSHKGKRWDISSCGTGGTRLSPATSKYNKFFETGDPSISYGCGLAEVDEGYTTALFSEIFRKNDLKTERCLAIIQFSDGFAINIRAHECLLRPSHLFLYLKQDQHQSLKALLDYYIEVNRNDSKWSECPSNKRKYDFFLKLFTTDFARLSANFEDEYIFCWLDWDGDNILMNGGIIDYGSVRQFGLCHNEYRYDDVERFSTNLQEQKSKAKHIVQTMIQAVDFIKTEKKEKISNYQTHEILNLFEKEYENQKNVNLLRRVGFSDRKVKQLLKRNKDIILDFRKSYSYIESLKSHRGEVKISDGVTCDAIFSTRNFLREFPQIYLITEEPLVVDELVDILKTHLADPTDLELNSYKRQKISEFQNIYLKLIKLSSSLFQEDIETTLEKIIERSNIINKAARVTGDAVTHSVSLFLNQKKKLSAERFDELVDQISQHQCLNPDKKIKPLNKKPMGLLKEVLNIFNDHREGI